MPNLDQKNLKNKFTELFEEGQKSFYKDRPEVDGVLFKDATFFNPTTGKDEVIGNVDKNQFNDLVSKGYSLKKFDQGQKMDEPKNINEGLSVDLEAQPAAIPSFNEASPGRVARILEQKNQQVGLGPQLPLQEQQKDVDFQKLDEINNFLANQQIPQQIPQQSTPTGDISLKAKTSQGGGSLASSSGGLGTNAYDKEMQAIRKLGEIESKLAADKAILTKDYADTQKKLDEQKQTAVEAYEKDYAEKQQAYENMVEDFRNTTIKNPDLWSGKNTGQKVLMGLGLFLGSAPSSSGQNKAGDAIQRLINRDLDIQKAELEKKQQGLKYQENIVTKTFEKFKNKELALNVARETQLNFLENNLKQLSANSESDKVKQNAEIAAQKINQAKYDTQLKTREILDKERRTKLEEFELSLKANKGPGLTEGGVQRDKDFAKEYNAWKTQGGLTSAAQDIKELEAIRDELLNPKGPNVTGAGFRFLPNIITPSNSKDVQAKVQQKALKSIKKILPGAISDYEGKGFMDRVFDVGVDEKTNAQRLDSFIKDLKQGAQQKEAAANYFEQNRGTLEGFQGTNVNQALFDNAKKVKVTDGNRILEIPESDLQAARLNGYKQVK